MTLRTRSPREASATIAEYEAYIATMNELEELKMTINIL